MVSATGATPFTGVADTLFSTTTPSVSSDSFTQQLEAALEQYLNQSGSNTQLEINIQPSQSQESGTSQFLVTVTEQPATTPNAPAAAARLQPPRRRRRRARPLDRLLRAHSPRRPSRAVRHGTLWQRLLECADSRDRAGQSGRHDGEHHDDSRGNSQSGSGLTGRGPDGRPAGSGHESELGQFDAGSARRLHVRHERRAPAGPDHAAVPGIECRASHHGERAVERSYVLWYGVILWHFLITDAAKR